MSGITPDLDGTGLAIGIVRGRFNENIGLAMLEACRTRLVELGVSPAQVNTLSVPGALEVPLQPAPVGRRPVEQVRAVDPEQVVADEGQVRRHPAQEQHPQQDQDDPVITQLAVLNDLKERIALLNHIIKGRRSGRRPRRRSGCCPAG